MKTTLETFKELLNHVKDHPYKDWTVEDIAKTWIKMYSLSDFQLQFTECTVKEAPLEVDIIFQTSIGAYHVGKRFMPTEKSNKPIYQDYKKARIRKHVIKWALLP